MCNFLLQFVLKSTWLRCWDWIVYKMVTDISAQHHWDVFLLHPQSILIAHLMYYVDIPSLS